MLKTTRSSKKLALKTFKADDIKIVDDSNGRANETIVNLFKNKKFRNLICIPNNGAIEEPNFLTPNTKKAFNYLRLYLLEL